MSTRRSNNRSETTKDEGAQKRGFSATTRITEGVGGGFKGNQRAATAEKE